MIQICRHRRLDIRRADSHWSETCNIDLSSKVHSQFHIPNSISFPFPFPSTDFCLVSDSFAHYHACSNCCWWFSEQGVCHCSLPLTPIKNTRPRPLQKHNINLICSPLLSNKKWKSRTFNIKTRWKWRNLEKKKVGRLKKLPMRENKCKKKEKSSVGRCMIKSSKLFNLTVMKGSAWWETC